MAYKKINPKFKSLWIDALRSGKYGQAQGTLYGGQNTYCCLGVLCEITPEITVVKTKGNKEYGLDIELSKFKPEAWYSANNYSGWDDTWEEQLMDGELNKEMREFVGLSDKAMSKLIEMNDNGKSFAEIATWIENNL